MLDRLRSQFVTPGFERNSGHMRLIGSFFRDTLKKCGYPQKYNEVTAHVSERAVSE